MYKASKTPKLNSLATLQHNYDHSYMHIQKQQAAGFKRYSEVHSYGMSFCNPKHHLEIMRIQNFPEFVLMKRTVKIPVPTDL